MRSYKVHCTDERTLLVDSDDVSRTIYIHHEDDNDIIYVGGDNVTVENGFHLHYLDTLTFFLPAGEKLYAVTETGEELDAWVLTPDPDDANVGLYVDPEPEEENGEGEPA